MPMLIFTGAPPRALRLLKSPPIRAMACGSGCPRFGESAVVLPLAAHVMRGAGVRVARADCSGNTDIQDVVSLLGGQCGRGREGKRCCPFRMMAPANVNRSTTAAHSRRSVKVFVHEGNGLFEAIAMAQRSFRSVKPGTTVRLLSKAHHHGVPVVESCQRQTYFTAPRLEALSGPRGRWR